MPERAKRPRDPNQLAKLVVDLATGEASEAPTKTTSEAAAALGRKGGAARARRMSAERRSEIARNAAKLRWAAKVESD